MITSLSEVEFNNREQTWLNGNMLARRSEGGKFEIR